MLYCGLQDGEMLWYMPEEIQAEYEKINNAAYADAVTSIQRLCVWRQAWFITMALLTMISSIRRFVTRLTVNWILLTYGHYLQWWLLVSPGGNYGKD